MKDTVIKNTGNSRFLRSSVAEDISFSEFIALLRAGQLPIDLAGINTDGIDILGTALNKANLLRDATALSFGLDDDAVPDDAFSILGSFRKAVANEYVWSKQASAQQIAVGSVLLSGAIAWGDIVHYSDSVTITDGAVALVNPQSYTANNDSGANDAANLTSILPGKYFYTEATTDSASGVVPPNTVFLAGDSFTLTYPGFFFEGLKYYEVSVVNAGEIRYVNSSDANAYPPAADDGFSYKLLGRLGESARIETGSYVGTGTYGSANPNSLTFDALPKLIVISGGSSNGVILPQGTPKGGMFGYINNNPQARSLSVSVSGTTVSWYSSYSSSVDSINSQFQLNGTYTYNYIAIW